VTAPVRVAAAIAAVRTEREPHDTAFGLNGLSDDTLSRAEETVGQDALAVPSSKLMISRSADNQLIASK
jgi:hypothetical protein